MKPTVLYWMQAALRSEWNPALSHAAAIATRDRLDLAVLIVREVLPPGQAPKIRDFHETAIKLLHDNLQARGITCTVLDLPTGYELPRFVLEHSMRQQAIHVIADNGELRQQRQARTELAALLQAHGVPLDVVDTNYLVSPAQASDHQEWSAATLRRKILPKATAWLTEARRGQAEWERLYPPTAGSRFPKIAPAITSARTVLASFLNHGLDQYGTRLPNKQLGVSSSLSPWLRHGLISPAEILWHVLERIEMTAELMDSGGLSLEPIAHRHGGAAAFIEQVIVRRELSANWCRYNPDYDNYAGLPAWARASLAKHRTDARQYRYSFAHWEQAATHDPYWNAAQRQLRESGVMHNHMRMYWGKKILEWSATPEEAFATAITLNDRYALDGRDPNGYAGVAWCFGAHDRPWGERPVFGMVRYMNAAGLERKFDLREYLERWNEGAIQ